MGIGFTIFLYGFLALVASILIYTLVRLFRSVKPEESGAEERLPPQVDTKTEVAEKPKGFWRRLWDNLGPNEKVLNPHRFWKRHREEEERRLSDDFSCGLTPSGIRDRLRDDFRGEKF